MLEDYSNIGVFSEKNPEKRAELIEKFKKKLIDDKLEKYKPFTLDVYDSESEWRQNKDKDNGAGSYGRDCYNKDFTPGSEKCFGWRTLNEWYIHTKAMKDKVAPSFGGYEDWREQISWSGKKMTEEEIKQLIWADENKQNYDNWNNAYDKRK